MGKYLEPVYSECRCMFLAPLFHHLPCRAVAHADDVDAASHAAVPLSFKVIDGIYGGWDGGCSRLYASRRDGQDVAETAPR